MEKLAKSRDMFVILAIIMVVVMMIVPMPIFLIDIMLALMFSVAVLVLLIAMYLENILDFSVFPGLLLVLTLFRISLNVSTTRMILAEGEAGEVIKSFGSFVASGNMIVGVIIFIILVIVQFVVITKGAGRIAEVAARFTLDAMPGKQMAVDSDLNAGILTEEEAKKRRADVSREADFYGAMDGASKFVKGDAVAGIMITVINIIGGFITGMTFQDMGFMEAVETYTLLTIGDGLVGQTPSLMISVASGIMVTRAVGEGNLGQELIQQFSQSGKALFVASGLMAALGLVPGMPTISFLLMSALLGTAGWFVTKRMNVDAELALEQEESAEAAENEVGPEPDEKVEDYLKIDQMEMEFGYALIPLVDKNQGGDLLERINMLRKQMATEMGIVVPPIRIRDNIQLQPAEYIVRIRGLEVGQGTLMSGAYLAMDPGNVTREIRGIETVEPAFGLPALWITESQKETAELAGYTVIELPAVLSTHLTEIIRNNASMLLTRQDVRSLLDTLKEHSSAVVEELIPNALSVGELQNILGNLLREGISVRDLTTILESLTDAVRVNRESTWLTEQVRQSLSRQICAGLKAEGEEMQVVVFDAKLEQTMEASVQKTERGPRLVIRPEMVSGIFSSIGGEMENFGAMNLPPILICSPTIRFPLRKLLESSFPALNILAYSEIAPNVQINSIGTVGINDT